MKFFIQFCFYMFFCLFYATCKLLHFFYTDNVAKKLGVQGITWLFPLTPYHMLYIFYYSEADGGYSTLRTIDNLVFIQCVGFCFFIAKIVWSVLNNLRTRTSAPDQLKKGQFNVFVEPRTFKQMHEIIFGERPSLKDYFLPTLVK